MVDATHTSYQASDRSYFSILKKDIHLKAQEAGFSDHKLGEIDLVIAEMTSNLHKFAKDGEILAGLFQESQNEYIELISIDNGPGMADTSKVMVDGFSTASTLGQGLGSIKRLSDKFDLFSIKGWGTIVLSRIYKEPLSIRSPRKTNVEIRPLVICKPGERTSGDGVYYYGNDNEIRLLVADGLGHGPIANEAVNAAVTAFKTISFNSPADILRSLHADIRKTRGMVATVVLFDLINKTLKITGIGNIGAKFLNLGGSAKNHVSYNGIIGHNIPNTINNQEIAFADFNLLVLCSDGIQSRWDITKYTGIARCDLTVLAAAIYKDFSRRNDDSSVIIVKLK